MNLKLRLRLLLARKRRVPSHYVCKSANYRCYRWALLGGTRLEEGSERAQIGNKLYTLQHKPKIDLAAHGAFPLPYLFCPARYIVEYLHLLLLFSGSSSRLSVPRYQGRGSASIVCKTINRSLIAPPRQDDNLCGLHVKLCLDSLPLDVNSPSRCVVASDHPALASYRHLQIQAPLNRP